MNIKIVIDCNIEPSPDGRIGGYFNVGAVTEGGSVSAATRCDFGELVSQIASLVYTGKPRYRDGDEGEEAVRKSILAASKYITAAGEALFDEVTPAPSAETPE